ncbi:related to salicylate 1-monooxygenase [Rhynchosporium agropyri]|uniref:Related to salicylate 1-monooxygenase n=1 Tax=Rhynchosporium agropyri TaxID=914238 RepID=A0A1E1KGQ0_9HELO|nr:related to salicylate 1-monooxygenase [Rhynchosporium agropyri]
MSNHLNILISGSGIAGSVFAFWLRRAYPNASITIVERDPALRLTGASVDIRSSAVDIIKWMGVEEEIRRKTTKEEGMQFVDINGKEIATFRATGRTDIQSFTSEFEIFRGELAQILIAPVLDRVKVIFGETVEDFEEVDDGINVTFAKNKEVTKYDLLVAADGLGSRIRGKILNTKPSEQIHDEGVHIAYFTVNSDLLKGELLAKGVSVKGGRAVIIRPDPHPEGKTRAMFMNVTWKSNVEMKKRLNIALREGNEAYMKLMEELYADVGWLTPEILRGMRQSDDFYCSLFAQIRSPKLHQGRVVLLGDAGYATPGFGTSLAIIGGYVLAGELLSKGGDVQKALEGYSGLMKPFVKASQGDDIAMQLCNPQTEWGIWTRNSILKTATLLRLDRIAISAAAWLGFTEKKAPLPNYPWPSK